MRLAFVLTSKQADAHTQASTEVTFPSESVRAGALSLIRKDRAHASLRDLDDHLEDA